MIYVHIHHTHNTRIEHIYTQYTYHNTLYIIPYTAYKQRYNKLFGLYIQFSVNSLRVM